MTNGALWTSEVVVVIYAPYLWEVLQLPVNLQLNILNLDPAVGQRVVHVVTSWIMNVNWHAPHSADHALKVSLNIRHLLQTHCPNVGRGQSVRQKQRARRGRARRGRPRTTKAAPASYEGAGGREGGKEGGTPDGRRVLWESGSVITSIELMSCKEGYPPKVHKKCNRKGCCIFLLAYQAALYLYHY